MALTSVYLCVVCVWVCVWVCVCGCVCGCVGVGGGVCGGGWVFVCVRVSLWISFLPAADVCGFER